LKYFPVKCLILKKYILLEISRLVSRKWKEKKEASRMLSGGRSEMKEEE